MQAPPGAVTHPTPTPEGRDTLKRKKHTLGLSRACGGTSPEEGSTQRVGSAMA